MKYLIIFVLTVATYYLLATKGTFHVPYDVDYFNPLAKSFLSGRLDIPSPVFTDDLSYFNGKWYPYWGPIPALLLIPFQLLKGRFVPAIYLSLFFSGLNAIVMWLIADRISREYFSSKITSVFKVLLVIFFIFGTAQPYLGTRSGVWYVSEIVSFFPTALAFYILIKKELGVRDYFFASILVATNFLNRFSLVLMGVLLVLRFLDDLKFRKETRRQLVHKVLTIVIPVSIFLSLFLIYNFIRFGSIFETGHSYMDVRYWGNIAKIMPYGAMSSAYILKSLSLIFLEIPKFSLASGKPMLSFNYEGISIFFVSPLFLAIFLTLNNKFLDFHNFQSRLIIYLWITFLGILMPMIIQYSPGGFQFGIRYSLDFTMILIALVIFGLNAKLNTLAVMAISIAVILNIYGLFIFK